MGLEELRARLDRLLSTDPDRRARTAGLHDALVELKVAAGQSRDALSAAERELAMERQRLADAERRGRLAAEIGDAETGRIAAEFAAKHRERIDLLERKVGVIRDELAYVEREYQSLAAELQRVRQGTGSPTTSVPDPLAESEREFEELRRTAERQAKEQAVQQQLDLLKKKLGKQ
jgi:chromosome segregation ATPase